MSEDPITDVMIRVGDVLAATCALEHLGMVQQVQGDGWTLLEHATSKQKVVVTDREFGSTCALSIGTRDLRALIERLSTCGWSHNSSVPLSAASHITLRHSAGLVAVAYNIDVS